MSHDGIGASSDRQRFFMALTLACLFSAELLPAAESAGRLVLEAGSLAIASVASVWLVEWVSGRDWIAWL